MSNIITTEYNDTDLLKRDSDGWISLTQMCRSYNKRLDNWFRLKQTSEFFQGLKESQCSDARFVEVIKGRHRNSKEQGTWGHPSVAKELERWLQQGDSNRKSKYFEKNHQEILAKKVNGKLEVPTKTGRVDILTDGEVIEVKDVQSWKCAIGQVLVYQLEFPERKARIHLYGECSQDYKQMIISYSAQLNILATFTN